MTQPVGNFLRHRSDLNYLWHGKSRAEMIQAVKNLGITDICTCEPFIYERWRFRKDSDSSTVNPVMGMKECLDCHYLQYPLAYVYDCDECTEPFILDQFPPPSLKEELYCFDCAVELA